MDADRMREIIKIEYGLKDDAELDAAVMESAGIDIGLFTVDPEKKPGGRKGA